MQQLDSKKMTKNLLISRSTCLFTFKFDLKEKQKDVNMGVKKKTMFPKSKVCDFFVENTIGFHLIQKIVF